MRENGREEEKRGNWSPLRPKVYSSKKSLLLQCVQLAYIATKTSKIAYINKSNLLLQGQNGKKSKRGTKRKTSNKQQEQCVRSEQCVGVMNSAHDENFVPCQISCISNFLAFSALLSF